MDYPDKAVLERILATAGEGVVAADARDPELPIVYVNPAYEALTGYTADQIVGRNARFLQGEDTEVSEGDELSIVPAIAGGR